MEYDPEVAEGSLLALMHNMGEIEYEGVWARCWFDLGTSDAIALDVLVNALRQFSRDYVNIETFIVGGENHDWRIPENMRQQGFVSEDSWN